MPQLAITTLGSLRVTIGGRPVDRSGPDKAAALLVYLAVEGGVPHRRETLAGLLWPESPEPNARHSLSQVLTDLRSLIGDRAAAAENRPPYLDTTRTTVALNPDSECWVDADAFETLLGRATPKRSPGPGNEGALEPLAQAVALYQGAFLEGFSIGDAHAFEEWMLLERERLTRQAIEALRRLTTSYTRAGDTATAVRYAWRWVEMDPWQEAAQRALIRLLALRGRRTTALRQYELCCRMLREELGVEPEAETRALVEAVRAGKFEGMPAGAPSATVVPMAEGAPEIGRLPAPLMPLVGRELELEELSEWLRDPTARLLTLVGPGGIGKTRLGLELARRHATRFPDGAYAVSLVSATSWEACVAAIAKAVVLVPSAQFDMIEPQLLDFLRGKTMLLVLDNFEHLLAYAPRLVRLMESAAQLRVIVTSRARLGLLGEHVYPVGSLAVPEAAATKLGAKEPPASAWAAFAEVASVKLFTQSARRVASSFDLWKANAPAVAAICRLVGGMPLALLLAAAWTSVLTPDGILERLMGDADSGTDLPIDFLHARWPDMPARHRSLRAVFDHTWRLLGTRPRMLVQALSVFRGEFGPEAAFFVTGATLVEIRQLLDQSLLTHTSGGRYAMQELLRQYAAERLAQAPVAEREVRDRHASYYVSVLYRWFEAAKGPRQVSALAEMDADIDNAQVAWDWIVGQGDIGQMSQAVDGLMLYYVRRVRHQEAVRACRHALDRLERREGYRGSGPLTRQTLVAKLLTWQSEMERGAEAMATVDRALTLLSSPVIPPAEVQVEQGRALRRQADLLSERDRGRAMALYEKGLSCFRAAGDRWEEAHTLVRLAALYELLGDLETARRTSETLLSIARELGDARAVARALIGLSGIAMYRNELDDAVQLAEDSLAVQRELDDPMEVVDGLQLLATRLVLAVRPELAMPLFDEAIAILDRFGLPAPYARGVKAWGLMHAGDYERALLLAQHALNDAHTTAYRRLIAWSEHVIGCLALVRGDCDGAVARLSNAVAVFRELGEPIYFGMTLSFLGYAYRGAGDRDRARTCLVEVLREGEQVGGHASLSWALAGMALLYVDAGNAARAHRLVTVVDRVWPFVTTSTWFADIAGPAYDVARAALPQTAPEAQGHVSDMVTEARAILKELTEGV